MDDKATRASLVEVKLVIISVILFIFRPMAITSYYHQEGLRPFLP